MASAENANGDIPAFFRTLFGDQRGHLCISSGKRNDAGKMPDFGDQFFSYPAQVEEAAAYVLEMDEAGREVYFGAHLLTAKQRTKENAAPLRVLYADGDGAQPTDETGKPSITVESSPGKQHYYWIVNEDIEPVFAEGLNKRIAYAMGADKSGYDLTQVLRVPGTHNRKYEGGPEVTVRETTGELHDAAKLNESLPPAPITMNIDGDLPEPVSPPISDEEVVEKIRGSKQAAKFKRLYENGDTNGYGKDRSAADQALCNVLSFYTQDVEQIDRLFRGSALMRDKWDEYRGIRTYGERTIRTALFSTKDHWSPEGKKKPSKADILAEEGLKADLFRTPEGDAYATVEVNGHQETHKLRTKGFKQWLRYRYSKAHGKSATESALQDALGTLESQALFEGEERKVFIRTAEHGGRVYLDLANKDWEVVEIGPDVAGGWRVIPAVEAPVRFKRRDGMQALPLPTRNSSLLDLRRLLNVQDQESWVLMLAWLVAALREKGPFPVLVAVGQQGSAKSTAMQILRMLVDPNTANIRSLPRTEQDLVLAASRSKVLAYDNLSYLSGEMSDTICRVATGGGFATRELYTDDGERIFWVKRPICLNGITDVAARPDLLDRSVIVNFARIEEYRLEEEIWPEFEEVRPGILGALLDAVSSGLARIREGGLEIDTSIRMADFGKWAVACEEGLGLQEGEFLRAYMEARDEATEQMLENDVVAQAIFRFMGERREWTGETDQLRRKLDDIEREDVKRTKAWPKTSQAFTNKIKRLVPALYEHGLTWERVNKSNKSRKKIMRWRDGFGPTIEEVAARWSRDGDEDEILVDNYLDSDDKSDLDIGKFT